MQFATIPNLPTTDNPKLNKAHDKLQALLGALKEKEVPDEIVQQINEWLDLLSEEDDANKLRKKINKVYFKIVNLVVQKVKLVPKQYYQNLWLAVGMSAFGIPIGVAFSVALDNFAFIGLGLPIGLSMGIAVGVGLDKKAEKEGRQLDVPQQI